MGIYTDTLLLLNSILWTTGHEPRRAHVRRKSYSEQELLNLAAQFAYNLLMRNWKAWLTRGSTTCNDGVVVLYSRADQIVYISVGDQLRSKLNTGLLSQILVDSRTFFASTPEIGMHYVVGSLRCARSSVAFRTPRSPPPPPPPLPPLTTTTSMLI